MFRRENFHNDLQHRFNIDPRGPDEIVDVYDSTLYKTWYNQGF